MSFNVFIIHAAEDSSHANELRARLRVEGINCSPSHQGAGELDREAELKAFKESGVVVFVFSAQANKSPLIERLLRHAFVVKKYVIHVYVEKAEPSATLKQLLKDARYVLESWVTPETRLDLIVQRVRVVQLKESVERTVANREADLRLKIEKRTTDSPAERSQPSRGRTAASKESDDIVDSLAQSVRRPPLADEDPPVQGSLAELLSKYAAQPPASPTADAAPLTSYRPIGRNSSPRRGARYERESSPRSADDPSPRESFSIDSPAQRPAGIIRKGITPATSKSPSVAAQSPAFAAPGAPPPPQVEQRTTLIGKDVLKEAEIAKGRAPVIGPVMKRPGFLSRLFNRESRQPIDKVDCSVFAPPSVAPAESFLVQVFAHCPDQAAAVRELAREFDRDAERHGKKTLEAQIQQGSKLTFHLVMPGLAVAEPLQSLTWWGSTESVQFEVKMPKAFKGASSIGTVTVCLENVPIGNIKFKLPVSGAAAKKGASLKLAGDAARAYQKAFISYASADRTEVLKRVQMLARLNIEYFQDVLTLEPGARWEKELYRHIDESDLFLLFWSSEAKRSKWVLEEVRYALKRKGADELLPPEIVPVIIEGPPPVAPPEELAHLHFNDYIVYFLNE